jgi:superfamily II DNA or RNA helicase
VALWLIAERKTNTLILVHRKQLMEQWAERISQFLEIPKKEIGLFGGGKNKRSGIIDIAVMQSVTKKEKVEDWVRDYGQIIVDECHHISASSFERIIRKCPARYRLGLSATVIRKDGQHPIVLMNLGPVRYSSRRTSGTFTQRVIPRVTDFQLPKNCLPETAGAEPLSIQDIFRLLCVDENRNAQIVHDIIAAHSEGREILVLTERIEHLNILEKALKNQSENLFVLRGGLGKKQLKSIIQGIHAVPLGTNRIILATGKYLGEGFDLPCLDTLFLVFPFSWKGTLIQYTGRLGRTYYGKTETCIYDYVDEKIPVLARMYAKRLKGYKTLGWNIENN